MYRIVAELKADLSASTRYTREQLRGLSKDISALEKALLPSYVPRKLVTELAKIRKPSGFSKGSTAWKLRALIAAQNTVNSEKREAGVTAPVLAHFGETNHDKFVNAEVKVSTLPASMHLSTAQVVVLTTFHFAFYLCSFPVFCKGIIRDELCVQGVPANTISDAPELTLPGLLRGWWKRFMSGRRLDLF